SAAPNLGVLTTASNAAGAAAASANDAAKSRNRAAPQDLPSIITVEVIGYGGGDGAPTSNGDVVPPGDQRRKKADQQSSYDPRNRYQIIGLGTVTAEEAQLLSDERRTKIGR